MMMMMMMPDHSFDDDVMTMVTHQLHFSLRKRESESGVAAFIRTHCGCCQYIRFGMDAFYAIFLELVVVICSFSFAAFLYMLYMLYMDGAVHLHAVVRFYVHVDLLYMVDVDFSFTLRCYLFTHVTFATVTFVT